MERNELERAPVAHAESGTAILALKLTVDASEVDMALAKVAKLKAALSSALNDASAARNKEKIVDALCQMAVSGTPAHRLAEAGAGLVAAIAAISS